MPDKNAEVHIQNHGKTMKRLAAARRRDPDVVFLCGPALKSREHKEAADVRREIGKALEEANFKVVLGEDDGLEHLRKKIGMNAQDNELMFIKNQCDAVVIVAGSVGSFCELGLFSWHYARDIGQICKGIIFIVVVDKEFHPSKVGRSYFSEGPIRILKGLGTVLYSDFKEFEATEVVETLENVNTIGFLDSMDS